MKPIVGVMPLWDEERDSIWMLPGYMDGIRRAGGIPVIFPLAGDNEDLDRLADICGGFLFTGGQDVFPGLYGEAPLEGLVSCCPERDSLEAAVLKRALAADKPVLGICRGIQFINVMLGGSLYQDIPLQHPSGTEHHQRPPYDVPVHTVRLEKNTPLYDLLGVEELAVNSYHHQGVKALGKGLEVMALSPDGLVEAVRGPAYRFLWAVQWHPEFSYKTDPGSMAIFRRFLQAMV